MYFVDLQQVKLCKCLIALLLQMNYLVSSVHEQQGWYSLMN